MNFMTLEIIGKIRCNFCAKEFKTLEEFNEHIESKECEEFV